MGGYSGVTVETLRDVVVAGDRAALTAYLSSGLTLTLTYESLKQAVEDVKGKLEKGGLRRGDVVSIVLVNSIEFVVTFLAVTWIGAVAAPLNATYTQDEFAFYLEDANAAVVVIDPKRHPVPAVSAAALSLKKPTWTISYEEGKEVEVGIVENLSTTSMSSVCTEDDVALFLHTSGTTSRPKGVPLTHHNLCASIRNITATYELVESDVTLLVMPLFHVHGLMCGLLSTLATGGEVVIPHGGRFSASKFWQIARERHVSWYTAVPTIHQVLLLRADQDFPQTEDGTRPRPPPLRFIRSCSSALAPATLESLEETFHAKVLEAYAMTEASHQMCSNPLRGERRPGSVGKGTNVEVAILSDSNEVLLPNSIGEVCIRGENVTKGYWNNPEANRTAFAAGWFHTGDQGQLSEDGYLTLTGRLKELINRGGEKISPLEVDAALLAHPAVAEAVSFAAPDEKYGEEVMAAVVLKDGSSTTENDLKNFCREKVAAFKVPKRFFFAQTLPRTATGKIQRRFVAAHFLDG